MQQFTTVCFLCGLPGADSDEHVVPRCFYDDRRPTTGGITARAHQKCNSSIGLDEQSAFVTLSTSRLIGMGGDERYERAKRTLLRPEAQAFAQSFLDSMVPLPGGGAMRTIDELSLLYVLAKIVKGFVYRETGQLLLDNLWWTRTITFERLITAPTDRIVDVPAVLSARWAQFPSEPRATSWWMSFYGQHHYFVVSAPRGTRGAFPNGVGSVALTWPRVRPAA
jgi:hypothetical protein